MSELRIKAQSKIRSNFVWSKHYNRAKISQHSVLEQWALVKFSTNFLLHAVKRLLLMLQFNSFRIFDVQVVAPLLSKANAKLLKAGRWKRIFESRHFIDGKIRRENNPAIEKLVKIFVEKSHALWEHEKVHFRSQVLFGATPELLRTKRFIHHCTNQHHVMTYFSRAEDLMRLSSRVRDSLIEELRMMSILSPT